MQIMPYLFFEGRAEEAANFYREVIGAKIEMLMHYSDSPEPAREDCPMPPGDKVMHMSLKIGDTSVLASDGRATGNLQFQGFALSLTVDDPPEAERVFNRLLEGGQVTMPLTKTFFSPSFGMLVDRFGVNWMIYVEPAM